MTDSLLAWANLQMDTIAVPLNDADLNAIVDETMAQTLGQQRTRA